MGINRGKNTVRTSPAWTPSPVPSLPSPCLLTHPNLTSIWGSVEPPAVTSQQGPVWLATKWRTSVVRMSREGWTNGQAGYFLQIWRWSKEIIFSSTITPHPLGCDPAPCSLNTGLLYAHHHQSEIVQAARIQYQCFINMHHRLPRHASMFQLRTALREAMWEDQSGLERVCLCVYVSGAYYR